MLEVIISGSFTFDRILSCTKSLSDHLQSTQIDLAGAANLVNATKKNSGRLP